jgi:hypothetical protein
MARKIPTHQHSDNFAAAAALVSSDPTVCAMDLPEGLTLDELADLRPLCGLDCEAECPYGC